MLFCSLMLLLAAPQQAQREPPAFMVAGPDHRAQIFLGFVAFGSEEALAKLAAAAKAKQLTADRVDDPRPELAVLFDSHTERQAALDFFKEAQGGAYGKLEVGMILVPPGAVKRSQ